MGTYGLFFLVAVAIGGVAWVFVYPILSGERKAERRVASVARSEPIAARPARARRSKSRREQVEGTLKDIEERRKKAKRVPLSIAAYAGRARLVETAVHDHRGRARGRRLSSA